MRYEIPMWTLCFASIMLYFANPLSISGIFSNIILITVSEISLFSSFRMSNFRTDYPCMYEISLISCITASFLLLISSTITFQNQDLSTQINGKLPNYDPLTRCFIAAITICGAVLLFNIIVLVWKGIMIKRLRFNPQLERNSRISLTWNEDIFKLMFTRYRMTW